MLSLKATSSPSVAQFLPIKREPRSFRWQTHFRLFHLPSLDLKSLGDYTDWGRILSPEIIVFFILWLLFIGHVAAFINPEDDIATGDCDQAGWSHVICYIASKLKEEGGKRAFTICHLELLPFPCPEPTYSLSCLPGTHLPCWHLQPSHSQDAIFLMITIWDME